MAAEHAALEVRQHPALLQLQFDLSRALYARINGAADDLAKMREARGTGAASEAERTLAQTYARLLSLYDMLQEADVRPTTQLIEAARALTR